jgi:hypothetical protein
MRRIVIVSILSCTAFVGCESKQAKIDKLQAQYKPLNAQYYNDCIESERGGTDAYFKGSKPKVVSPQEVEAHHQKCAQELRQVTAIEQQITALSK